MLLLVQFGGGQEGGAKNVCTISYKRKTNELSTSNKFTRRIHVIIFTRYISFIESLSYWLIFKVELIRFVIIMKNLRVLARIKTNFEANIIANCIDADNKRYFALTEDFNILESQDHQLQAKAIEHDFDKSKYEIENLTCEDVILMEYVVEIGSILIILVTGHFIHIGVSSFSPPSDCQFKHAERISSVKISPDQDLIAMADTSNGLFISHMNDYANSIHATNALDENESLHKPVGVGWGSKETQFFGLDGRPAKETECKVVGPSEVIEDERICDSEIFKNYKVAKDKSTLIDWRGDGQLIATLTYIPDSRKHYLKVWNRNLELQYMSEQLITMEGGLLSWIPNGQYVCCGQRRDGGVNDIVMFEKNGMVHQRVSLPTLIHNFYIKTICWSPDSRILAILGIQFIRNELGDVRKKFILMLYTMQNFQYYLKYSAYLTCEVGNFIRWDPINHNRLYVSSLTGLCQEYDCSFTVTYSQDHLTVAVLYGNKVMVTPFTICNIPPPMSAIKIELGSLINRIILGPGSVRDLFLLTMNNRLIYARETSTNPIDSEKVSLDLCVKSKQLEAFRSELEHFGCLDLKNGHSLQNFTVIKGGSLLATNQLGHDCQVLRIDTSGHEISTKTLQTIKSKQVISIAQNFISCDRNCLFLDDGTCVQMNIETGDIQDKFSLESTSDRLNILRSHYVEKSEGAGKVISLTQDHTLRVDGHIISSNSCTSFLVSENFLIYTTTDNNLHFVPMSKILIDTIAPDLESYCQPIETGGTLILVSEKDSKVILQMPRGNLEVLHPRILVLLSVSRQLDQRHYLNALKEARRHRVDLNFLCDYLIQREGKHFYQQTLNELVLEIVRHDQSFLNLFINDLKDENTIFGRYATIMRCLPVENLSLDSKQADNTNRKVNEICSNVDLDGLLTWDSYLQPHILCLIRQKPSRIGTALYAISQCEDVKPGLDFLLYYIDIEQLFLEALATYDTNLALMVANASSKDPKQYLALLDKFNEITDEHLRRYEIDMHVKRYDKAFKDLLSYYASQDESNRDMIVDRILTLVESKRLYNDAVRSIGEHELYNKFRFMLWEKYGDYLLEKRYHLEAGLAYWKATRSHQEDPETFAKAMKCLLLVEDWQKCVLLMKTKNVPDSDKLEYNKKISDQLLARGKFTEALIVRQQVIDKDLGPAIAERGAINLGYIVVPEIRSMESHHLIKNQICEQCAHWDSEYTDASSRFERLKQLIADHQTRRLDNPDADNCYTSDSLSTIDGSDASSIISGGTGKQKVARSGAPSIKTRTSSKSSKSKSERGKKINLKTGSRHEDIAIILELKKFVEKQKSNHELARQILATALIFMPLSSFDGFKQDIDTRLTSHFKLAEEITSTLWPNNEQDYQTHSLYRRFGNLFTSSQTQLENVDFLVLVRPDAPKDLTPLEI